MAGPAAPTVFRRRSPLVSRQIGKHPVLRRVFGCTGLCEKQPWAEHSIDDARPEVPKAALRRAAQASHLGDAGERRHWAAQVATPPPGRVHDDADTRDETQHMPRAQCTIWTMTIRRGGWCAIKPAAGPSSISTDSVYRRRC